MHALDEQVQVRAGCFKTQLHDWTSMLHCGRCSMKLKEMRYLNAVFQTEQYTNSTLYVIHINCQFDLKNPKSVDWRKASKERSQVQRRSPAIMATHQESDWSLLTARKNFPKHLYSLVAAIFVFSSALSSDSDAGFTVHTKHAERLRRTSGLKHYREVAGGGEDYY